jgi:colanic acid/amylovoran biosynthesis glycosyltransferase
MKFSPYAQWSKLVVSRLGVDPAIFLPRPAKPESDLSEILCVGRLTQAKGQHVLIDAVDELARKGRRVRLRLVGDGPDGPALREQAKRLENANLVVFEGAVNQDNIRPLYEAADIFCLPSLAEGIPVVLMEAMAMEIPCVTSHITGIPELIRSGTEGLLVAPSDLDALVRALETLMDDAVLREHIAKAGRARILKDYDLGRNVERLAAIFADRVKA